MARDPYSKVYLNQPGRSTDLREHGSDLCELGKWGVPSPAMQLLVIKKLIFRLFLHNLIHLHFS